MKGKILWVGVLVLIVGGVYGAQQYTSYRCTNEDSVNWQYHKLISCEVYFDEGGSMAEDVDVSTLVKIEGAYIPAFQELDKLYAKDAQNVYYKGNRVAKASVQSFNFLGGEYFVDSHAAYFRGLQVLGSDARSFSLSGGGDARYARDAAQEYFEGLAIEELSAASSTRFLLSPYDGEEITRSKTKEIFWRPVVDETIDTVAIALVGDDDSFTWLTDESQTNTGSYDWVPSEVSSTTEGVYHLVFYGHTKQRGVTKIDTQHMFTLVEDGKPGVQLKVEFRDDRIVEVSPNDTVYVSWASSNVEHCYLANGVEQSLVGHMTARFPQVGNAKVTDHVYTIMCTSEDGETVEDKVTIRAIAK
jgi:hypothetical protein